MSNRSKDGEYIELGWNDFASFHAVWGHVPDWQALVAIHASEEWVHSDAKAEDYGPLHHAWGGDFPCKSGEWDSVFRINRTQFPGSRPITVMWRPGEEWTYGIPTEALNETAGKG